MSNPESGTRIPPKSNFRQQRMKGWEPILTSRAVIPSFFGVGAFMTMMGIIFYVASDQVIQVEIDYTTCTPITLANGTLAGQSCSFPFTVSKLMKAPVYVYYQLTNYFQNHRNYVKSYNILQLQGKPPTDFSDLLNCEPRRSKGESENPADFYIPCGIMAWSAFNDTIGLRMPGTGAALPWQRSNIAHKAEQIRFADPNWATTLGIRDPYVDFRNEDFMVWMRPAALPSFRKLYAIIQSDVAAGDYVIDIVSRFPVASFEGTKGVTLSTASWIGGKNNFLGIAYIVVGVICILLGIILAVLVCVRPRSIADQRHFWRAQ